jgi:hypothetical protein
MENVRALKTWFLCLWAVEPAVVKVAASESAITIVEALTEPGFLFITV